MASVRVERDEAVGIVTLDRPERRNALSPEVMGELATGVEELDGDPRIHCIVIAGSDEVFAAGADIQAMSERSFQDVLESSTITFWNRLAACRTPMIAAVSGFALGGGCELALMCDMIVASETAEFGQPEITLGIIPGGGGTQRLARVIGKQRAMELVLTGRRIDAKEALRLGFVNKVSGRREWHDDALELARVIARRPAARGEACEAGSARGRGDLAHGRARARAAPVRARDGDRGPRRGHARVPGEAPALVRGPLMTPPNVFTSDFDEHGEREGFRWRGTSVAAKAGSKGLGASVYELPPGEAGFPYHYHLANEELLVVLRGRPHLRTPEGWRELAEGEVVAFPVGEGGAHQLANRTPEPVRLLMVSQMRGPDIAIYPDAGKVGVREHAPGSGLGGLRANFLMPDAVDYWEGETPPEVPD